VSPALPINKGIQKTFKDSKDFKDLQSHHFKDFKGLQRATKSHKVRLYKPTEGLQSL